MTELLLSLAIIAVLAVMAIGSREPADSKASSALTTMGTTAVAPAATSRSSLAGQVPKAMATRNPGSDPITAKWVATLSSRA